MAAYQQIFLDNAFGNYEDLLTKVTLSSVMGDYLNMVNNDKPVIGVNPNENYARELLQLFAIGLWELNPDGTQMLDASGKPMPSYDQPTVEGFAHVFTGWTYPLLPGTTQKTHNPKNFLGDMTAVASNHDTSSKLLLNGFVEPAGLTMDADLNSAIHNVFMHPNTGPFVVQAAHPKAGHGRSFAAIRGAGRRGLQRQRQRHARRHDAAVSTRSCSMPKRAATSNSTRATASCASRRCSWPLPQGPWERKRRRLFRRCRRSAGTEPVLFAVGLQLLPARPRRFRERRAWHPSSRSRTRARTSTGPMS